MPTDAVRALADQPGWKMVVVGDRKTPVSWSLPNVVFLDLKAQRSLGYQVLRYLPYDSYTRKTIGYLYAIQHGAKYIFETDDDNFPEYGVDGFQVSQDVVSRLVLATNNLTNNPYVHFGQSTMWPRGYPLERIGLSADRHYNICETRAPPIQLGVVNGDPDVDAIFRLSRRHKSLPLRLKFDHGAPPYVLPPRTFAPFNSQNTFFSARAFWAMVLSVTSVPDRAVDIYRTYWAQRLLWLIGDGVAFAPPSSIQIRNQHSDLVDAEDESLLYRDIGRYIQTLNEWECADDAVFMFDCISSLSRHLVTKGFWKSRDADMVDAWLADLASVGYTPPVMMSQSHSVSNDGFCQTDPSKRARVILYPVEQNTSLPHSTELLIPPDATNNKLILKSVKSVCGPAHGPYWSAALQKAHKYPNVLLVISVRDNIHAVLPMLETIYRPHFPNIIYCTKHKVDDRFIDRWKVSILWIAEDANMLSCIAAAGAMEYGVHGVLHVSSNMLLNAASDSVAAHADSLVWMTGEFDAYSPEILSLCYKRSIHCVHMSRDVLTKIAGTIDESSELSERQKTKLRACIAKVERDPSWVAQKDMLWIADIALYMPLRLIPRLVRLREVLSPDDDEQRDLLVPLMLECEQLTVNYLRHSFQIDALSRTNGAALADYIVPFPFDKLAANEEATKQFCAYVEQFR
jgi:hypothetical protein